MNAVKRGPAYQQSGWKGFGDKAPAYADDEVVTERNQYDTTLRI